MRFVGILFRRHVRSKPEWPECHGLVVGDTVVELNRDLYRAKVFGATDLLHQYCPRHLARLRRFYPILLVASIRGSTLVQEANEIGVLRLSPRFVWNATPEEIALEMAAASTRARGATSSLCPRNLRYDRRLRILGFRERVWVARRLPSGGPLAEYWSDRLARLRAGQSVSSSEKLGTGSAA